MKSTLLIPALSFTVLALGLLYLSSPGQVEFSLDPEGHAAKGLAKAKSAPPKMEFQQAPDSLPSPIKSRIARLERLQEETIISPASLQHYLDVNNRRAGSLLAAASLTGERSLMHEALEKFHEDPRVAYTAWFRSDSPDEKIKWLQAMKASAPENSLASYLLANELFRAGQSEEALRELQEAHLKPSLSDYKLQSIQDHEEAYLAAGVNELDAKALSTMGHVLPYLSQLKQLGIKLTEVASQYSEANDPVSRDTVLQMTLLMGQRLSSGQRTMIEELVGIAIETHVLKAMDPDSTGGLGNSMAAERLQQLAQHKQQIKSRVEAGDRLLETMSDEELRTYLDRLKLLGEGPASEWLFERHPEGSGVQFP